MKETVLLFFLVLLSLDVRINTHPVSESEDTLKDSKCGYKSCPQVKKGKLNVHLVPHTHDDVGWLKTVDQYYFGSRNSIAKAGVQYIIDTVIDELLKDEKRRFIYVETAFFWKWWREQHDIRRHQVKKLVSEGRLEFIGGGWSMNDEAATHYHSTIDQFTWGFRKLNDTFGACGRPRIGWQIDPFGHSREMASIMARLGFDGLFFGRLDYQDKDFRLDHKTAEMIWQGSPDNIGTRADLFTGVLFNNYSPPPSFCFDILCDDEPIIDDKKSPDYNADRRAKNFIKYVKYQSKFYSSDHVIITMGDDFNYQDANSWFKNLDKLIRNVNAKEDSNVNVFYSTPSCYLKAVNEQNLNYTTKQDDFFPYASDPHAYWTGYFTSRPTLKYFERRGNNFLQVCKQLHALTDLDPKDRVDIDALRSAMGVMQHHDAVTGTEKQQVAFDYARILSSAISECELVSNTALRKLMLKHKDETVPLENVSRKEAPALITCPLLNISQCETTENFDTFVVTLYNPLSYPVTKFVRLPITDNSHRYSIRCPMGKEHISQIVPIPESVQNIPGRFSQGTYELVFEASKLPPLGFRSYFITKTDKYSEKRSQKTVNSLDAINTIGNPNHISYTINNDVAEITVNNKAHQLHHDFYYYKGAIGNNEVFENRSSGAYIFRPNGSTPIAIGDKIEMKTYKGPIVDEIHETFSDWVSQIIRVYKGSNHVEFNWLVGPIPINDNIGKEVISRFNTNMKTHGYFYTDSNGREILERKKDFRPTWKVKIHEPISGNYYPVTSKISLKDKDSQFSVLTDRAQGGSSIHDGEVELMVHRRLLADDAFGVGEALNETAFGKGLVVRGTHYLTFGGVKNSGQNAVERFLAQQKILDVWTFFTPAPHTTFDQWKKTYNMHYSGLTKSLPQNVQILTLEPWKGRSLLLRLEHIFEKHEDDNYSKPVTVDLKNLFSPFTITSLRETTLGANLYLKELKRLKWNADSNSIPHYDEESEDAAANEDDQPDKASYTITLNPMEIKTFIIDIHLNSNE